jgi:hypothetical protein
MMQGHHDQMQGQLVADTIGRGPKENLLTLPLQSQERMIFISLPER